MTSFMDDFKDKVVYVTGGSSGIGASLVEELRRCGAEVNVADLNAPEPTDVADSRSVQDSVRRVVLAHGRIDAVFAVAGKLAAAEIEHMDDEVFDRVVAVNLRGAFLVAKHTIPALRAAGGGAMVFTGSTSSLVGAPGQGAYCASKAGIVNLVRVLAAELAGSNIRVNCVCPGWIDTPFNDPVWEHAGGRQEAEQDLLVNVPMRRQGQPEEVIPAMLFLASNAASYITGEIITVDGGLMATR